MIQPQTLKQMAGADLRPNCLKDSVLLLIDLQNEYESGALPLLNIRETTIEAAALLERARAASTPVVHVQHVGRPGGLFDVTAKGGAFLDAVTPRDSEAVVQKDKPNSFADTDLRAILGQTGRTNLIVVGAMTHMCVSSTVRVAFDLGYHCTVVSKAVTTRALPLPGGGTIEASDLHEAALAALSDNFAVIVDAAADIPD